MLFRSYMAAFIGPVAVGVALDAFGGAGNPTGWAAAFVTMALGSTAASWAMRGARTGQRQPLTAPASGAGN